MFVYNNRTVRVAFVYSVIDRHIDAMIRVAIRRLDRQSVTKLKYIPDVVRHTSNEVLHKVCAVDSLSMLFELSEFDCFPRVNHADAKTRKGIRCY